MDMSSRSLFFVGLAGVAGIRHLLRSPGPPSRFGASKSLIERGLSLISTVKRIRIRAVYVTVYNFLQSFAPP